MTSKLLAIFTIALMITPLNTLLADTGSKKVMSNSEQRKIDNISKKIDKLADELNDKIQSGDEISEYQLENGYPKKIESFRKQISRLDGAADSLEVDLDELEELLAKAQSSSASASAAAADFGIDEKEISFAETAAQFYRTQSRDISVNNFRYSTEFSQASVDALINSLQNYPAIKQRTESFVEQYKAIMDDAKKSSTLLDQSKDTYELLAEYESSYKSRIERFVKDAKAAFEDDSDEFKQMLVDATNEADKHSYYRNFVGNSEINAKLRGLRNIANAYIQIKGGDTFFENELEKTLSLYRQTKEKKAEAVINSNQPAKDVYTGSDKQEMATFSKQLFAQKVGLEVLTVVFPREKWQENVEWHYVNGVYTQKIYSVNHVNIIAALNADYAGEFVGFIYKDKHGQYSDFDVASYNKGDDVPPSVKIKRSNLALNQ